ncbi:TPA: DUF1433 domain-containing protein [Staphylococcus aureus]|uniref:DUF1433 domain-containing protein n=1 Tax=Staphylococcus aureus TaxID=1280 RepID=UPI00187AD96C|nr:DUF1433 domain-containing protein [Staphylococcus aureus]MBE7581608.1 DUF1433 domain-containing protein [Staphylococcus aureus]MCD4516903.1 DUF1433 domain-containing protein [Staphylococcus aureus]HBC4804693.1 DUF1433 domain-containing protein [Staphylococcus aureus]HBC4810229.1 DUF1433 domain-containing protein [Staphylococcus aureus]HDG5426253.1 DUF1433 domain-containing protein [Staphylococcus aureus]
MSKKIFLIFISIIFIILIIIGGVYIKMKYDEHEKQKEIYYKEQQERISLYLKHNTKEPNTIKSVHFKSLEQGPMGDAVIEGYINNNKKYDFTAFAAPEHNFQFGGSLTGNPKVFELLKPAHESKSPDEIKKELDKKKDH